MKKMLIAFTTLIIIAGSTFAQTFPFHVDYDKISVVVDETSVLSQEEIQQLDHPSNYVIKKTYEKQIRIQQDGVEDRLSKFLTVEYNPQVESAHIVRVSYKREDKEIQIDPESFTTVNSEDGYHASLFITFPQLKKSDFVTFEVSVHADQTFQSMGFSAYYPFYVTVPTYRKEVCISEQIQGTLLHRNLDKRPPNQIGRIVVDQSGHKLDCTSIRTPLIRPHQAHRSVGPYGEVPTLYVSTWQNWTDVARDLQLQNLFPALDLDDFPQLQILVEKVEGQDNPIKIEKLYTWVQKNIEHTAVPFYLNRGWLASSPSVTAALETGTASEKVMLLIDLLQKVGIAAYPAFIGTQAVQDAQTDYVVPAQFNHVLVYVDTQPEGMFLDPSNGFIQYPYLPSKDLNRTALILKDNRLEMSKTPRHISVPNQVLVEEMTGVMGSSVDPTDPCSVIAQWKRNYTLTGSDRAEWLVLEKKHRNDLHTLQTYLQDKGYIQGNLMKYDQQDDVNHSTQPYKLYLVIESEQRLQQECEHGKPADTYALPLFLDIPNVTDFVYAAETPREHPYILNDQKVHRKRTYRMLAPEGMEMRKTPVSFFFHNGDLIRYNVKINRSKDKTEVEVEETLQINTPVLTAQEFNAIKDALITMYQQMQQQIILK
ncbi:MAG: hypothetical protein KDK51_08350 [Deltaproteobacteria bacterium]|nr:hypothetical protein [Deltaproteobacteria bacterium]